MATQRRRDTRYLAGLRSVLERNRLQQRAVAEALGVSRIAVGAWVNGHSMPSALNAARLVEWLQQYEHVTFQGLLAAPVSGEQAAA